MFQFHPIYHVESIVPSFICPCLLQLQDMPDWPAVKALLALGETRRTNTVVDLFCKTMIGYVSQEESEFRGYPIGGQHLTAANRILRQKFPNDPEFHTLSGLVFLPMPVELSDQVLEINFNFCNVCITWKL